MKPSRFPNALRIETKTSGVCTMTQPVLYIGNKNFSASSLRPWLLLKENGVPFQEETIRLYDADTAEKLGPISPSLKLPVLLHDDIRSWDSLSICEYISDTFLEGQGWPRDLKRRAAARSIAAELHSGFTEFNNHWPMNCQLRVPLLINDAIERDIARLDAIMYCCRRHYGDGGDYLFGRFSIADCLIAPYTIALRAYAAELSEKSSDYLQHLLDNPHVIEWIDSAGEERSLEKRVLARAV